MPVFHVIHSQKVSGTVDCYSQKKALGACNRSEFRMQLDIRVFRFPVFAC